MSRVPLPVVPDLPREIQIEVTGACNLRCRMCLVRYRPPLQRVAGSMPFETFRSIVDALPGLSRLTLQGLGEPMLAPDLFEMVEYAASRGIQVGFNTNATLLGRQKAERLAAAGLAWLCFSVDGARPETFEAIRDGASFDRVAENIRGMVAVLRERGATRPDLSIVFVAMKRNIAELPDMVRLAAGWGVPKLRVQNLSHSFEDTASAPEYKEIFSYTASEALWQEGDTSGRALVESKLAESRALARSLGVSLRLPALADLAPPPEPTGSGRGAGGCVAETSDCLRGEAREASLGASRSERSHAPPRPPPARSAPGCDWPWRSTYVRHDARVQPCCMLMGEERAILGDARADGLEGVWRGPAYAAFRAALLSDAPPEPCRGCSMYKGVF